MKKNRKTKARHYPVSPEQDHPEMPASSDTRSEDTKLLLHCLESLYVNPVYSDWTIVCGTDRFAVHRCILSMRCEVLAKEFEWNAKNQRDSSETSLPDDPLVVKGMIQYLYTGDYSAPEQANTTTTCVDAWQVKEESENIHLEAEETEEVKGLESSDLPQEPDKLTSSQDQAPQGLDPPIFHARIYALAHRFLVHGLKVLASKNFRESLERYLNYDSLSRVVEEVYRPISEEENNIILDPSYQQLREIVVNIVLEHLSTLRSSSVLPDDFLKNNLDFACDLCIAMMSRNGSAAYPISPGPGYYKRWY